MTKKLALTLLAISSTVLLLILASTIPLVALPAQATPPFTPAAFNYLPAVARNYQSPTPISTATPTSTPPSTSTATPTPTHTPTLPPPSFDGCQEDPNPSSAGNYPVRIVTVYKAANPERVRLQSTSSQVVDLTGWHVCSITGNQEHTGISGTLSPGQTKDFTYSGIGFIWNNTERDDGALYNSSGQLVSYWIDQ